MAPADEPAPSEGPLAELATAIREEFRRCMEQKNLTPDDWVEVRTSDFNLWVAGVGAVARNRASLDSRLQALPDMIPTLRRLLVSLKQSLTRYRASGSEEERNSSKEVIDMLIDNLAMLATVIRQTGRRSRFKKADLMFDPKRQDRYHRHLECIVRLRPTRDALFRPISPTSPDWLRVTSDSLEEGSPLTQLQKRLIEANLKRRYWFLYAQRHSEKLAGARPSEATRGPVPVNAEQANAKIDEPSPSVSPSAVRPPLHKPQEAKNDAAKIAFADKSTIASTVESKMTLDGENRKRNVALTTITSILAATEYPRLSKPDKTGPGMRKILKCPCCCQALPATVHDDAQAWKKHLAGDIRPYTCIAENCPTPDVLYSTRKDWENHVKTDHDPSRWECPICHDASTIFSELESLLHHVTNEHADELPEESFETIHSWGAVKSYGLTSCPLCDSSGSLDDPELVDHVLQHTHDFALRSLPWPKDLSAFSGQLGTFDVTISGAAEIGTWVETVNNSRAIDLSSLRLDLRPYDASIPASEEECGAFDYFGLGGENNDYFADASSGPSFSAVPSSQDATTQAATSSQASTTSQSTEASMEIATCLKWLDFSQAVNRYKTYESSRWLLAHRVFKWWADEGGAFCIVGNRGSGKSTLLQYALDRVLGTPDVQGKKIVLWYFFHSQGTGRQRTAEGLFQSLIAGLIRHIRDDLPSLVYIVDELYGIADKRPGSNTRWHLATLVRMFMESLRKILETNPVWLFIDGLDEMDTDSYLVLDTLRLLLQDAPPTSQPLRICTTSRYNSDIGQGWVVLEGEDRVDIPTYVQDRLSNFELLRESIIPAFIVNHAIGNFLWARIVTDEVVRLYKSEQQLKDIQHTVLSLPSELSQLYRFFINNVPEGSVTSTLSLFEWICFATRPLSLAELRWALLVSAGIGYKTLQECESAGNFDITESKLLTLGCGLAETTLSSGVPFLQFIHPSAKEFFVEKGLAILHSRPGSVGEMLLNDDVAASAHWKLARTCALYLAMGEVGNSSIIARDELMPAFPLLHYATTSWVWHTKRSDTRPVGLDETVINLWIRIFHILESSSKDCPPDGTTMIHVASRYALWSTLYVFLHTGNRTNIDIDIKDGVGNTPLIWAAINGHETILQLLLENGANVNLEDTFGLTPLSWAAESGHETVVRLLLEGGADTERETDLGRAPLSLAAEKGHEAVVQLLLKNGAMLERTDTRKRSSLSWAAVNGHDTVVRRLLEAGANIDVYDGLGQTPLSLASENGHEAVVQLLLENGADIEMLDGRGRTALFWAVLGGNNDVARRLLEKGANIETEEIFKQTPLLCAAEQGLASTVRLLLTNGANIEAKDVNQRTPLATAAIDGREAVTQLLLDNGANIEAEDQNEQTPLVLAVRNCHNSVVQLLLQNGANIEAKDDEGKTPLTWAVIDGHDTIVRLLLDNGADTEAQDNHGNTPFFLAKSNGLGHLFY